jgi:hypothetical protein
MADHALMALLQSLQISKRNSLAFANPNLLPHYSNNSSFAYTPKLVIVFAQQHQSAQRVQHRLKRIHQSLNICIPTKPMNKNLPANRILASHLLDFICKISVTIRCFTK